MSENWKNYMKKSRVHENVKMFSLTPFLNPFNFNRGELNMPFQKIKEWLDIEKSNGSTNPDCIVLATATRDAVPHTRIVAIKEEGLVKSEAFA